MINFNEFSKFPNDTKDKIMECVFASNVRSEIDRIKKDINDNGEKSEFSEILLESINLKYNNLFGRFYEVTGLFHVSQRVFGIDIEEDND